MDATICPECGQPLERADDFWYCDNPACKGRGAVRHPVKEGAAGDGAASEPSARHPADGSSSDA